MQSPRLESGGFSAASFFAGVRRAVPIVLGYLPIGFAFGILAGQAGLSVLETGLMCLLVFAGSSQFIAVNMIMAGVSPLSIIMTTFVVNARHLLMSAAMLPYLRNWSKKSQMLFSFGMADEVFVTGIGRFASHGVVQGEAFGLALTAYLSWAVAGVLGAISGKLVGDMRPYGLDFALIGVFIALLAPYCRLKRELIAALIAGVLSLLLYLRGVEQWNIIIAAVVAATAAVLLPPGGGKKDGADKDNCEMPESGV